MYLFIYSNNRFYSDGVTALAKALQVNETLKQLKVHSCIHNVYVNLTGSVMAGFWLPVLSHLAY